MGAPRRITTLAVLIALSTGLAACAAPLNRDQRDAREQVAEFLRTTAMQSYRTDMDDVVRAAASGVQRGHPPLVDWSDDARGERLGTLTFAVTLSDPPDQGTGVFSRPRHVDPGPYCFRVAMGYHGKLGEFGTTDGIREVDCPDPLVEVTPPPRDDPVVADNARDAAWQVLTDLPPGAADADEVAAAITDLLEPSDDENRPLADVEATTRGTDVGVATGGPDDCVLVARIDGEVTDVEVARVQLQPGEAGCTAGTALAGLRPPH